MRVIEMVTVCGSCAAGEHMCGGGCHCWCLARSTDEIDEMNGSYVEWETSELHRIGLNEED